jgi:hypothetical protein
LRWTKAECMGRRITRPITSRNPTLREPAPRCTLCQEVT